MSCSPVQARVCADPTSTRPRCEEHFWHHLSIPSPATAHVDAKQHAARTLKTLQTTNRVSSACAQKTNNNRKNNTKKTKCWQTPRQTTRLAPHTTVCGSSSTPGAPLHVGLANTRRCHSRHRQQQKHHHTRRETQHKHQVHQTNRTTYATYFLLKQAGIMLLHALSHSSTHRHAPRLSHVS